MKNFIKSFLVLVFTAQLAHAQIEITFPLNRIVFQRNNQNISTFSVAGYVTRPVDRIDARLVPVIAGQGVETTWTTIATNLSNSSYNGELTGTGGWYRLEVRAITNDVQIGTNAIERVGIGEVFILSGQSNAQGDPYYPGATEGSLEDRVSTIDFCEGVLDENRLPFEFSQLGNNKNIAPYHYVPYFWSKLGDLLVQKFNVPVLFYGTALGGIGSDPWKRSAAGEDLRAEYGTFVKVPGMPYRAMKAALNLYAARTGVRSILWLQGESDRNSTTQTYFNNMQYVINKSRSDFNKPDLSWMIARNTVPVAQNLLITNMANVFAGPNTDLIDGPEARVIGHFAGAGLRMVADAYMSYLTNDYFQRTNPQLPNRIISVSSSCNSSNGNIFASLPTGYTQYSWSNGQQGQGISFSNATGLYSSKLKDAKGNVYQSAPIYLPADRFIAGGVVPLSVAGNTQICNGGNLTLSVNVNNLYQMTWSNGSRQNTINPTFSGNYSAIGKNILGCSFTTNSVPITVYPKPNTPNILSESNPIFCEGNKTTLAVANLDGSTIRWTNGLSSSKIDVNQTGSFAVNTINSFGCISDLSNVINVDVLKVDKKPIILVEGKSEFCIGEKTKLIASGSESIKYKWNINFSTKEIEVNNSGNYSVQGVGENGCLTEISDLKGITVYPLASTPSIVAESNTEFCEGNKTTLSVINKDGNAFNWSNGLAEKKIEVNQSGNYSARVVSDFGCVSEPSNVININVLKVDKKPTITALGVTKFCSGENVKLVANNSESVNYNWKNGDLAKDIVVAQTGEYAARGVGQNGCLSEFSDPISITVYPAVVAPTITAKGPTSFCIGESVKINATGIDINNYKWKNGLTTSEIDIAQSGDYAVQGISQFGCISPFSNNIIVTVFSKVSPPIISAFPDTTICEGGVITIKNNTDDTVLWSDKSFTKTQNITANRSVYAQNKDVNGCFSDKSNIINLNFKPNPAKPIIEQIGTYSLQQKIESGLPGTSYQWYLEDKLLPETLPKLKAIQDGQYSVKSVKNYGTNLSCYSSISEKYLLKNGSFIEKKLSLFPNPTLNGIVTLEVAELRTNVIVDIVKANGSFLARKVIGDIQDKITLDLAEFGYGFYILKIYSNEGSQVKRVLFN